MALQFKKSLEHSISSTLGFDEKIFYEFEYEVGRTPLSNLYFPLFTVISYCILIPLLQNFMSKTTWKPNLKSILIVHNLFLCLASAALAFYLVLTLCVYRQHHHYNAFQIVCGLNFDDQKGALNLAYYINHLLKYYELLDTIFLALKRKNIGFLHAYHHPATLVLTWTQLVDNTSIQWVVILLNLFVHVVMYFYYFMSLLKIRMPWKKCVTIFQILQFVIDIIAIYGACIQLYFFGGCRGTSRCAIIGAFIITSYLYLFVDFYAERYAKKEKTSLKVAMNGKVGGSIAVGGDGKTYIQPLLLKKNE